MMAEFLPRDPGVIYPEDFGAAGDGVTDDGPAFQAAVDAAKSGGIKEIRCLASTYLIERQTTDRKCGVDFDGVTGLTLRGAGRYATTIKMEATFVNACRGLFRLRGCHDITICDLTMDGSWTDEPGDEQIHLIELAAVGEKLGVLSSNPDGTTPTVTLATAGNANNFTVGLSYDFWADLWVDDKPQPTGEPIPGGPYVCSAKDAAAGTVTFTTNVAAAVASGNIAALANQDVKRIWIRNVSFRNARGDAIRFQGETTNKVRHVFVENVDMISCKRAALTFQRNVSDITVSNIYAENVTDSIIDMEPSPSANALPPRRIRISNGTFRSVGSTVVRMISMTGFSTASPCDNVDLENIHLSGGVLQIFKCRNVRIRGLNLTSRDDLSSKLLKSLEIREAQDVYVGHSTIARPANAVPAEVIGILTDNSICQNIVLEEVFVHQYTASNVILVQSSKGVTIKGGNIYYEGGTTNTHVGVHARANTPDNISDLSVIGATFRGDNGGGTLKHAIRVQAHPHSINKTRVEGCRGTGLVVGACYDGAGTGFTIQPRFANNDWTCSDTGYTLEAGTSGLEAIITEGSTGTRTVYQGAGSPEDHVTGSIGDWFWRTDGAAGTLGYQKDTEITTRTGWVAKL
jgi:hypothetical protein